MRQQRVDGVLANGVTLRLQMRGAESLDSPRMCPCNKDTLVEINPFEKDTNTQCSGSEDFALSNVGRFPVPWLLACSLRSFYDHVARNRSCRRRSATGTEAGTVPILGRAIACRFDTAPRTSRNKARTN